MWVGRGWAGRRGFITGDEVKGGFVKDGENNFLKKKKKIK